MLNIEMNLKGDIAADLSKFEAHVKESVLFSGVAAMAKLLYDEARIKAPVSDKEHWFHGTHQKYLFQPGTLRDSIYRVYAHERSNKERKTYRISWNHEKAPYGFMVEYGTSRAPAHPFMRPAFDRVHDAIAAGNERMAARLTEGGHIPVAQISSGK